MVVTATGAATALSCFSLCRYFAEHDKVTALQMLNDSLQPKHKYVSHPCLLVDTLKGELQGSTEKLSTI